MPGAPTISPSSTTSASCNSVLTGHPVTSMPSQGGGRCRVHEILGEPDLPVGSQMAMSASSPIMIELRG